jgi:heme-degrading monooxygenase HmoA
MICRIWHGRTPLARADEYERFLRARALPDYRATPGNLSATLLRRDEGEITHFVTQTLWESEDAVRAFAGNEVLKARYYPEDSDFLLEFERFVQHYIVVATDVAAP